MNKWNVLSVASLFNFVASKRRTSVYQIRTCAGAAGKSTVTKLSHLHFFPYFIFSSLARVLIYAQLIN